VSPLRLHRLFRGWPYASRLDRWPTPGLLSVLGPALGLAAPGCREGAESPTAPQSATPTPAPGLAMAAAEPLAFRQVSAGLSHTCGVTTDDRAYCWGSNARGQLGDGTTTGRTRPVAVAGAM
jgi:hypothetical protein